MTFPRVEKKREKWAWIILVAIQVLFIGFNLHPSPGAELLNDSLIVLEIVGLAVTLKPFRQGKKWAWYFLWYLPAIGIAETVLVSLTESVSLGFYVFNGVFTVIPLLGLFLPYRKFFPSAAPT